MPNLVLYQILRRRNALFFREVFGVRHFTERSGLKMMKELVAGASVAILTS